MGYCLAIGLIAVLTLVMVACSSTITSTPTASATTTSTPTASATPAPTLSSLAVTPASPANLTVGATQQFTATGTYSDSSTTDISSQVTWASDTTGVATISSTGLATGVAAGTANITAALSGVTSPEVILTIINMPTATPSSGAPTTNNNFSRVQGTLMVNSDGTITITPTTGTAVGPLTLNANTSVSLGGATLAMSGSTITATATLSGAVSVMYNSQTNTVNRVIINMPAMTPGSGTPTPGTSSMSQGTLAVNSDGTITITPTTGTAVGPLTLDANTSVSLGGVTLAMSGSTVTATATMSGAVSIMYNSQTNTVSWVMINMPARIPGSGTFTPGTSSMSQGTLAVNSDGTITITPTTGTAVGPLTLNANTSVSLGGATLAMSGSTITATATLSGAASVNYNSQTNTVNRVMINMPAMTPGSGTFTPGTSSMSQGTLAVNSDGTITITPTTGTAVGPLTLNANTSVSLGGATLAMSGSTVTATATLSGAASVIYNSQTNAVNGVIINMPARIPGSGIPRGNFGGGPGSSPSPSPTAS